MKRLIGYLGAIVAGGIMAIGTASVANAMPDVDGQTYGDAAAVIQASGGTPKVATRVGNKGNDTECVVTNASDNSFIRHNGGRRYVVEDAVVLVSLNCTGK